MCRTVLETMRQKSGDDEEVVLTAWEREIDKETRTLQKATEMYKAGVESMKRRGEEGNLPPVRRLILSWFEPLRDAIAREQQAVRSLPLIRCVVTSMMHRLV